jgi:hypothetical protein
MLKYYFHCSDGSDLLVDREGIEITESEVLWSALRTAARLMSELPSYDGWADWVVAVHDERGSLVDTVPFPANEEYGAFDTFEHGTVQWTAATPKLQHRDGSTRLH